ncbi:unnamed protein product [Rhodiola kirilowii]
MVCWDISLLSTLRNQVQMTEFMSSISELLSFVPS